MSEENVKAKICPLLRAECQKAGCALWCDWTTECALWTIPAALFDIQVILDRKLVE